MCIRDSHSSYLYNDALYHRLLSVYFYRQSTLFVWNQQTTPFAAGNQPTTAKWEGNINITKLSKYLNLESNQHEEDVYKRQPFILCAVQCPLSGMEVPVSKRQEPFRIIVTDVLLVTLRHQRIITEYGSVDGSLAVDVYKRQGLLG